MIDLRLGRWEDVLGDVEVDALITDPPFGQDVHESAAVRIERGDDTRESRWSVEKYDVNVPVFDHWTPADVERFVAAWSPRTRGWIVALTSHDLIEPWRDAFATAGRYSFAPVPCVITGMTCRLAGDGPSSWAVYAMVARPRTKAFLGGWTNPGAYVVSSGGSRGGGGAGAAGRGKPAELEHALVRDYSRAGDLVCDPMAGWGGFLRAAVYQGRRAIGAEIDRGAHRKAVRLSRYLERREAKIARRA